jgi:ribonuclease VapC
VILDSSAVVAVLIKEPGYEELATKMREADVLGIGAPTLVEIGVVMGRRTDGDAGQEALSRFRQSLDVIVIPFGEPQCEVAADAFIRYGKGRHPAKLNFGDCMSYATARVADKPLLFVGNDFARTDIDVA